MSAKVIPFPSPEERRRRNDAKSIEAAAEHIRTAGHERDLLIRMANVAVGSETDRPRYGGRVPFLSFATLSGKSNTITVETYAGMSQPLIEQVMVSITPDFTTPLQVKGMLDGVYRRDLAEPLYMVTYGLASYARKFYTPMPPDPDFSPEIWQQTAAPAREWAAAHRATAAVVLQFFDVDTSAHQEAVDRSVGSVSAHLAALQNPMPIEYARVFFKDIHI